MLQKQYRDLHLCSPIRNGAVKHIFIYFGGVDKNNLTYNTLLAFIKLNRKDIYLDVVISVDNPNKFKIIKLSKINKNIKIYFNLSSLANLMIKADLAIGACGATSWERLCLGLPVISNYHCK